MNNPTDTNGQAPVDPMAANTMPGSQTPPAPVEPVAETPADPAQTPVVPTEGGVPGATPSEPTATPDSGDPTVPAGTPGTVVPPVNGTGTQTGGAV